MKYTKGKNYFGETIETISINRLTWGFDKETDIGSQLMQFENQCKKSKPKKIYFKWNAYHLLNPYNIDWF